MFVDRYVSWKVSLRANDTRISKYLNYSILISSLLFTLFSFLLTLFSFSTLSNPGEPSLWVMNLGPDAIEKRTEVQFYDRFDLIGEGNHTDSSSEGG